MGESRGFPTSAEILAALETVLGTLEEGVHIVDAKGYTIFYNQAMQSIEGLTGEEVLGRHVLEVFPSLSGETSTFLNVLNSCQPITKTQQTYRNYKGQELITINTTLPIIHEEQIIGAVEISRNITAVKELTDRMADLQAELYSGRSQKPRATEEQARYVFEHIIGQSPGILAIKEKARRTARTNSPILVYGETGTGKELLVQAIHNASPRGKASFVSQNCAAIPESLLEGLLFGTVKGAFTGAADRPGLFELAHGGTLFLDEINSMDLEIQAKLLRVLQDSCIRRIGDIKVRPVDVRVIAATNVEPYEAVTRGQLRADLFYRLNVVYLPLPPLRERKEDIPLLTENFVRKFNQELGLQIEGLAEDVRAIFARYDWPGNIRELEGVIAGAMNFAEGNHIELHHLPTRLVNHKKSSGRWGNGGEGNNLPLPQTLTQIEREIIANTLERHQGNISQAAEELGIPRQTLQYRLNKLGLA